MSKETEPTEDPMTEGPQITDATHVLISRQDAASFLMSHAEYMAVPRDQENPKPPEES